MIAHLVRNINSNRPKCRGVSIVLRQATGHRQPKVAQCRKRGRKGGKPRAKRGDPVEQATTVNASEGVMRRRQGEPAYVGYCPQGRGRPKRERFLVWFAIRNQAALDTGPGVKHRPKVAQSGCTERWNPPTALSLTRVGDQARSPGGEHAPRSQGFTVMVEIC